ncbi:hypothetical protein L226DRAFT_548774 [Lentinus tigrinus ALCF2SS1-7]|uniref:uncharacterized protein n=1 Tax=Lentinus tigrinus ALCF2SS1-7 TaxID=1328758 RepID=UPI0011660CAB|nr:hypothetical protein L226DRAFT_548774 [Lentinus tigrinus ALCF2SS1-7]
MDITKEIITITESFPAALEPIDFIERLCIRMGVHRQTAQLVYRWNNEPASTRRPLAEEDDVMKLYVENVRRKEKWRAGNKEVKICVDNLNKVLRTAAARREAEKKRKRDEAVEAATKDSEEQAGAEFEICRQKLRCPHNQTGEAYCWTNPSDPQKRCQRLELWELQAWARAMKNQQCDRECTLPPNSSIFDRLTAHQSERAGKKAASSAAPSIVIHNHLGALSDLQGAANGHRSAIPSTHSSDTSSALSTTAAFRKIRTVPLPIHDALAALDDAYPDSKYSSYEDALKKEGFYYAENILHFAKDRKVFTERVGMPIGAVPMFLQLIEEQVATPACKRRRLDGGTAVPADQENVAPV